MDYPQLARTLIKASGDLAASKLPPGLYVVATPIGNTGDITLRALMTLAQADIVACEDTRVTGSLLARYGLRKKRMPCHDHNASVVEPEIVDRIVHGEAVALVSDAGLPLISDPGFGLVRACREQGLAVTVLPGANAALAALAGSGLPTDAFHFAGFLPAKTTARRQALSALKAVPGTLVFYESPQRLGAALADMDKELGPDRRAAVARELTKLFEETQTGTLGELSGRYRDGKVKGEIVVLVGPAGHDSAPDACDDLDMVLTKALETQSLRDAVAAVSDATGLRKSDVYARALEITHANRDRT